MHIYIYNLDIGRIQFNKGLYHLFIQFPAAYTRIRNKGSKKKKKGVWLLWFEKKQVSLQINPVFFFVIFFFVSITCLTDQVNIYIHVYTKKTTYV